MTKNYNFVEIFMKNKICFWAKKIFPNFHKIWIFPHFLTTFGPVFNKNDCFNINFVQIYINWKNINENKLYSSTFMDNFSNSFLKLLKNYSKIWYIFKSCATIIKNHVDPNIWIKWIVISPYISHLTGFDDRM